MIYIYNKKEEGEEVFFACSAQAEQLISQIHKTSAWSTEAAPEYGLRSRYGRIPKEVSFGQGGRPLEGMQ